MRQQNICPQELSHLDHFRVQQCPGDMSKIEVRTSYGGWLRIVATICYKALVPLYWSHTSLFRFMQPRQKIGGLLGFTWACIMSSLSESVSIHSCWTDNTNHNTRNISETLCLQYFTNAGHHRQTEIRHQVASFLVETSTRVWPIVYRSSEIVCSYTAEALWSRVTTCGGLHLMAFKPFVLPSLC